MRSLLLRAPVVASGGRHEGEGTGCDRVRAPRELASSGGERPRRERAPAMPGAPPRRGWCIALSYALSL